MHAILFIDQKQVLYLVKVGAAIFFDLHPYIVAPIGATDKWSAYIQEHFKFLSYSEKELANCM